MKPRIYVYTSILRLYFILIYLLRKVWRQWDNKKTLFQGQIIKLPKDKWHKDNGGQKTTQKTKDWATRTSQFQYPGRVGSSCSTSATQSHFCRNVMVVPLCLSMIYNVDNNYRVYRYLFAEVNKNVKDILLSMCDVKLFLTFASLDLVLLWQLFYLFCSSIVINTVIVTAGTFES